MAVFRISHSFVFVLHFQLLFVVVEVTLHHLVKLLLGYDLRLVSKLLLLTLEVLNIGGNYVALEDILHLNQRFLDAPRLLMCLAPHREKLRIELLIERVLFLNERLTTSML